VCDEWCCGRMLSHVSENDCSCIPAASRDDQSVPQLATGQAAAVQILSLYMRSAQPDASNGVSVCRVELSQGP